MDHHHNHHKRHVSLKNKEGHNEDHKQWSRRSFLQMLGIAGGTTFTLGGLPLSAMTNNALLPLALGGGADDRTLVLIRLNGGNDGLNTIIPLYDYGTYQNYRPTLAIPQNNIINLNNSFGIPNVMNRLMPMWNNGQMKVINTVGYENHNLSHFDSSDIWGSGKKDYRTNIDKSGWMGRYILDRNPDILESPPPVPAAIKIGSQGSIVYHNENRNDLAVSFATSDGLANYVESGQLYDTSNLPNECYFGEQVGFLRSITNSTLIYSEIMSETYNSVTNSVTYSNNPLSRQLAIIARFIKGNLGTKLFLVTLGGFDTHEYQAGAHSTLLTYLSQGISEFYADLAATDHEKNVLAMTFSEFGRRVNQNASLGTDHGTAAPIMLFGSALNGNGMLGDNPDLQDLNMYGNLKHSVDFRSVYASVLESWLCVDPVTVDYLLGDAYDRLDLGFECITTNTNNIPIAQGLQHSIRPDGYGGMVISYHLDRPGNVNITIHSVLGQKITTLVNEYQLSGKHEVTFASRHTGLSSMALIYTITVDKKSYSDKFVVAR